MSIAIYPGTFDPITYGHSDIIKRTTRLFDKVIVAIAANPSKKPLFSLEERIQLTEMALADLSTVEICGFDKLLIEFAAQCGATVIVRGLRAVSDFEYEFQLAGMNRCLMSSIETIFITPASQYTYISSSLIKEIAYLGGTINDFVHPQIAFALSRKMNKL
jgi:pantetheine-phosphate adenylyltransferase